MKIATIMFTYDRPEHTKMVLDSLKSNINRPEQIIVFHDGLSARTDVIKWNAVEHVIDSVDWCTVVKKTSKENMGLANSVVTGMNWVMEENDAAIVIEDDCKVHPLFYSYMVESLEKYEKEKNVYSIGGYNEGALVKKRDYDAYFAGRITSWGWATWRDRWAEYKKDDAILKRILLDQEKKRRLDIWGADLQNQVVGNILGRTNSWAVYWALHVIERGGYSLMPIESLVTNLGCDGSGTHSGNHKFYMRAKEENDLSILSLPDEITSDEYIERAYQDVFEKPAYGTWLKSYKKLMAEVLTRESKHKLDVIRDKKVALWGIDALSETIIDVLEVNGCIVKNIIETTPSRDSFKDITVCGIEEIESDIDLIIVFPFYDIEKIKRRINYFEKDIETIGLDEFLMSGNAYR